MSFTNNPRIVTNGLILCLDASDRNSYFSGSTIWRDISENNRTGSLINGPAYSNFNIGVVSFDGTNDYVDFGSFGANPTQGTMQFWFQSTEVVSFRNVLTTGNTGGGLGGNIAFRFEQNTTTTPNGGFTVIIGNGNASFTVFDYSPSAPLRPNKWYHVSLVWNSGSNFVIGHLDGVQVFSGSCSTFPPSMSLLLGVGYDTSRYLKGNISSVLFYNRVLTNREISQNYQTAYARFVNTDQNLRDKGIVSDGLVIYYDASNEFSFTSGSSNIYDLSGNANTGLLSGSSVSQFPTYTSNYLGGLDFNATSSVVAVQTETNVSSSEYTIETILSIKGNSTTYTGGNSSIQYIAMRKNRNTGFFVGIGQAYVVGAGATPGRLGSTCTDAATNTEATVTSSLAAFNTPFIMTSVYNSTNTKLYVNGVLQGTTSTGFPIDLDVDDFMKLGRASVPVNNFDGCLNGTIYSFKLYNRSLSDSEVLANFNAQRVKYGL